MNCIYDYVLFDLDGTLSASAPGIQRCIELTMRKMNKEVPDLSDYSKYIGPPLITTFKGLCKLSEEEAKDTANAAPQILSPRRRLFLLNVQEIPQMSTNAAANPGLTWAKKSNSFLESSLPNIYP